MSHQGTKSLLSFAESLPKRAENVEGFFDHKAAAEDLRTCAAIITRLAPLDSDIEVVEGEN